MSAPKKSKGKSEFYKHALDNRYHASRWVFIFATLIFFLNYLFVGGSFYYSISLAILPYTYIAFIVSIIFFFFFTVRKIFDQKLAEPIFYVIFVVIALVFSAALLPFIMKLG